MNAVLCVIFSLLLPVAVMAEPMGSFPMPRAVHDLNQSPSGRGGSDNAAPRQVQPLEERAIPAQPSNVAEPASPGEILPPDRPQRALPQADAQKEAPRASAKPWEYEKPAEESLVKDLQKSIDESYYEGRMRVHPLSPGRIKELRRESLDVNEAMRMPAPKTGKSRFRQFSLQPGADIPHVSFFPGNAAMIRFVDSTGAPWPILSFVVGNGQDFVVQKAGGETEQAANVLIITPIAPFADTSLAVTLAPDNPAVLMLHASAKNDAPDYLVTFRADVPGPNAAAMHAAKGMEAAVPDVMLSFLDGVPPKGAKRLASKGPLKAWEYQGKRYVRTDRSMIWPSYSAVVKSNGAMRVYELPLVSSVVLDGNGALARYRIIAGGDAGEWENALKDAHRADMEQ